MRKILYSERESARLLAISYGYLKVLRRAGEIRYRSVGRRGVRYTEEDLIDFVERRSAYKG
jgi:predicted site-specific integrase-resolvase